jgi:hypothetical protein
VTCVHMIWKPPVDSQARSPLRVRYVCMKLIGEAGRGVLGHRGPQHPLTLDTRGPGLTVTPPLRFVS